MFHSGGDVGLRSVVQRTQKPQYSTLVCGKDFSLTNDPAWQTWSRSGTAFSKSPCLPSVLYFIQYPGFLHDIRWTVNWMSHPVDWFPDIPHLSYWRIFGKYFDLVPKVGSPGEANVVCRTTGLTVFEVESLVMPPFPRYCARVRQRNGEYCKIWMWNEGDTPTLIYEDKIGDISSNAIRLFKGESTENVRFSINNFVATGGF